MPRDRLPMLKGYTNVTAPCGHPSPCGCEHVTGCCVECPLDECEFDRREAAMKRRQIAVVVKAAEEFERLASEMTRLDD